MPIEANCPSCNRLLRVADSYAGRQARCPACNTIYVVPGGEAATADNDDSAPEIRWFLRTPEGQVYGPVARQTMDDWVAEGRVTNGCQLRTDRDLRWQAADEFYGVLRPQPRSRPVAQPTRPTAPVTTRQTQFLAPHRGVLVLLLGIFGWVFACPVFSVIAWAVGNTDLREMRLGRMDPAGMDTTRFGKILGMVHTLICLGVLLVAFFLMVLMAFAG